MSSEAPPRAPSPRSGARGHEARPRAGLVAAIMRIVFLLFAEGEGPLARPRGARALRRPHPNPSPGRGSERRRAERGGGAGQALTRLHLPSSPRTRPAAWRSASGAAPGRGSSPSLTASTTARARPAGLFDPGPASLLLEERASLVPDRVVLRVLERLAPPSGDAAGRDVERIGTVYEGLVGEGSAARTGSHYTSRAITRAMVGRTLAPWLHDDIAPGRDPGAQHLRSGDGLGGLPRVRRAASSRRRPGPGLGARRDHAGAAPGPGISPPTRGRSWPSTLPPRRRPERARRRSRAPLAVARRLGALPAAVVRRPRAPPR